MKIGYSVADFVIARDYSPLVPISSPNDTSIGGTVKVGYEDTLSINSTDSYDPDYAYLSPL
jgi:hypothetical protein